MYAFAAARISTWVLYKGRMHMREIELFQPQSCHKLQNCMQIGNLWRLYAWNRAISRFVHPVLSHWLETQVHINNHSSFFRFQLFQFSPIEHLDKHNECDGVLRFWSQRQTKGRWVRRTAQRVPSVTRQWTDWSLFFTRICRPLNWPNTEHKSEWHWQNWHAEKPRV